MSGEANTAPQPVLPAPASAVAELGEHLVEGITGVKPRFRGWIHLYSAFVAIITGSALVAV
ncbi:MAG: hemolysin III family protein, partial [Mycobacterium sp.]|nr:hemolysin III family protein [Mycobacterium sp.]